MTDNDIIKALECCTNKKASYCKDCPLKAELPCVNLLAREAFDLINRQKAEIKTLQERNVILRGAVDTQKAEIENLSVDLNKKVAEVFDLTEKLNATIAGQETLQKALDEKNAEIERLKAEAQMADGYADALWERAKTKAVKEFAERLKGTFPQDDFLRSTKRITEDIDNLVKEMVGDAE